MEKHVGLDELAKADAATFYVARFAKEECKPDENPSPMGWAVATKKSEKDKGVVPFKIVLMPEHMRTLQDGKSPLLSSPYLNPGSNTMNLKKGRRLESLSIPVHACVGEGRPQVLYRVVHAEHPGHGLQSRGYGTVKTDSLSFMIHFSNHLDWKRRDASPFLSTTSEIAKAATLAAVYERKGFQNIEVLLIKVGRSEWPTHSTIWDVRQTADELGLSDVHKKPYYDHEYLIEDHIPISCVSRIKWEDMRAGIRAEATETCQTKKRKRSDFESDGQGGETVLSDGQDQRSWGLVENYTKVKRHCYYTQRGGLEH